MQQTATNFTDMYLITSGILLAVLFFMVSMTWRVNQRLQIHRLELATVRNEYNKNLLEARLEAQEHTFRHIAREIHDDIGQRLATIKLTLATLPWQQPGLARTHVAAAVDELTQAFTHLRALSHNMAAHTLESSGLAMAVRQEVEK